VAPHALTSQRTEADACRFLNGYFTERFAMGDRPSYGYPKNHLPETTLEEIEVVTGFMAAKPSK
jgi:hypothetical protein